MSPYNHDKCVKSIILYDKLLCAAGYNIGPPDYTITAMNNIIQYEHIFIDDINNKINFITDAEFETNEGTNHIYGLLINDLDPINPEACWATGVKTRINYIDC